jgi:hypothetical protein
VVGGRDEVLAVVRSIGTFLVREQLLRLSRIEHRNATMLVCLTALVMVLGYAGGEESLVCFRVPTSRTGRTSMVSRVARLFPSTHQVDDVLHVQFFFQLFFPLEAE